MNIVLASFSILFIALAFLGGMAVMYYYQPNLSSVNLVNNTTEKLACPQANLITNLNNPIITSVAAKGEIKSIKDNVIVLVSGDKELSIKLSAKAVINDISNGASKVVKPSDLKVGQLVNAGTKALSNGDFEAFSILILDQQKIEK